MLYFAGFAVRKASVYSSLGGISLNNQQLITGGSNSTNDERLDEVFTVIELSTCIEDRMYRREDYPFPMIQKAMDHLRIEITSVALFLSTRITLTVGGTGQRNMMMLDHAHIVLIRISLNGRWN